MQTNQKREPAFTDTDLMPFGKYKDEPLQDVPAKYLVWLWNELRADGYCKQRELRPTDPPWVAAKQKLANYIWNSQDALAQETGETL